VQQNERYRIAVAIAHYCFYSGTAAVTPLLNLTNSGSDVINEVAVTHLCSSCTALPTFGDSGSCGTYPRTLFWSIFKWLFSKCAVDFMWF